MSGRSAGVVPVKIWGSPARNPVHMAVAVGHGAHIMAMQNERAQSSISRNGSAPSPETSQLCQGRRALYDLHHVKTCRRGQRLFGCNDVDYRGYVAEATGANMFFVKDGEVHTPKPDCFSMDHPSNRDRNAQERGITVNERHIMPEELRVLNNVG